MLFRFSSVSSLSHDCISESHVTMPPDLHPAVLGSGEIGLAVDTTGLQGLNSWQNQMSDTLSIMHQDHSTNWNLYIHRDQALSRHHHQQGSQGFRIMPCGWLDYSLRLDGRLYGSPDIQREARNWSRQWSPRTGILATSYDLGDAHVTLKLGVAPGSVDIHIVFEITWRSGQARPLEVTLTCHQTLRDGRTLFHNGVTTVSLDRGVHRLWLATDESSTAEVLEPITLGWGLGGHHRNTSCSAEPHSILATSTEQAAKAVFAFLVAAGSDRDGTHGAAHTQTNLGRWRELAPEDTLRPVAEAWSRWMEQGPEIWIGEPDKEFLFLQQQHLLRAGESFHAGIVLGTFWNGTFGGSTFFDSLSVAEGMLRCGRVEEVREFCRWLVSAGAATGRPFYHMTFYNGRPAGTDEEAFHVSMAYGGIFVRLHAFTRDRQDLESLCLPYMERLMSYLFDKKLCCQNGEWQLKGEVSPDGHLAPESLEKFKDLLLWIATLTMAYESMKTSVGQQVSESALSFNRFIRERAPHTLTGLSFLPTWLPYLTNHSFLFDASSYGQEIRKRIPEGGRAVHEYQPWNAFSFAMSCLLTGFPDQALEIFEDGHRGLCGLGYFDESLYEMRGGGFAPYPPATGTYLALLNNFIADGGIEEDSIRIGTPFPCRWISKRIRFRNVHTLNGACVSGILEPDHLDVVIHTTRPRSARIGIPPRIQGEPLDICHNECAVTHPELDRPESVTLALLPGNNTVRIRRNLARRTDLLVIEPHAHGIRLAQILAAGGTTVRLLRNYPLVPEVRALCRGILIHTSYASLPAEVVRELESAARDGASVTGLFHSGRMDMDTAFATLAGVCAGIRGWHWNYESRPVTFRLTPAGRSVLSRLPETFEIPLTAEFAPTPLPDVEVLAATVDSGTPLVTRRRVGRGWVSWCAFGNKSADGPQYEYVLSTNEILNHGFDYERRQQRLWLDSPHVSSILQALLTMPPTP